MPQIDVASTNCWPRFGESVKNWEEADARTSAMMSDQWNERAKCIPTGAKRISRPPSGSSKGSQDGSLRLLLECKISAVILQSQSVLDPSCFDVFRVIR